MSRFRSIASRVLVVVSGFLLLLSVLAGWANTTIYDSTTFSERSVDLLNSPAVRRELASRLTEQLARSGNEQAINFRPAFQLAVEAAIDTDTFRSIFRTAVKRTHVAILEGQDTDTTGLDLSDSIAIISSTLQLPGDAKPGQGQQGSLGASLADTTSKAARLGVWHWQDASAAMLLFGAIGSIAAAAGAIALSTDRRRMVRRLGVMLIVVGLVLALLLQLGQFLVGRSISDPGLSDAVQGALARTTADLFSAGLWIAGYGVVVVAAASALGQDAKRVTPRSASQALSRWVERRRRGTGGTIVVGILAIVAGLALIADPGFFVRAGVVLGGLWFVYFGVTEVLRLVRVVAGGVADAAMTAKTRRRRAWAVSGVVAVLAVIMAGGLIVTTRGAASKAAEAGQLKCNGEASLCDLPVNQVLLPASHNSMSSALYPGWLLAEQISTIGGQLDAGIRVLLIDTHYGIPSKARLPGSESPIILTDRASELQHPGGEGYDQAIADQAERLASSAPVDATAKRGMYLCHNFCEMGAIPFSSGLADIKKFVDTHPDDVVMTIIQDATTPAETAAAIEAAGLGDKAYTLDKDAPMPTLGDLVNSGRTLLVWAEEGQPKDQPDPEVPSWYQNAYDFWWQETPFAFKSTDDMNCKPSRGPADAPFFLINHWVTTAQKSPAVATKANSREVLESRIRTCVEQRGLVPSAIALDFAERGDLVKIARDFNGRLRDQLRSLKGSDSAAGEGVNRSGTGQVTTTTSPGDGPVLGVPFRYTTLTGGDPTTFCATTEDLINVTKAWVLASLVAPPSQRAVPDLTFGPAAQKALAASMASGPSEFVAQVGPLKQRADNAVQALRDLGLDQRAIDELANIVLPNDGSNTLAADPTVIQRLLTEKLEAQVQTDKLTAASAAFWLANPQKAGLFDLGQVPDDVAKDNGYACLISS